MPGTTRAKFDGTIRHVSPGVNGYTRYKCRCPECAASMESRWLSQRERDTEKRRQKAAKESDVDVDWSTVAYLIPGYGVRR